MRNFIFTVIFMSSGVFSAMAQDSKPDFICKSIKTGSTYSIFYRSFTEVRYVDKHGKENVFNYMIGFDLDESNTVPKIYNFRFFDQNNTTVAAIYKDRFNVTFTGNNDEAKCYVDPFKPDRY